MVLPDHREKFMDFTNKAYQPDLGVKLGYQYKQFATHICCKIRVENLRN